MSFSNGSRHVPLFDDNDDADHLPNVRTCCCVTIDETPPHSDAFKWVRFWSLLFGFGVPGILPVTLPVLVLRYSRYNDIGRQGFSWLDNFGYMSCCGKRTCLANVVIIVVALSLTGFFLNAMVFGSLGIALYKSPEEGKPSPEVFLLLAFYYGTVFSAALIWSFPVHSFIDKTQLLEDQVMFLPNKELVEFYRKDKKIVIGNGNSVEKENEKVKSNTGSYRVKSNEERPLLSNETLALCLNEVDGNRNLYPRLKAKYAKRQKKFQLQMQLAPTLSDEMSFFEGKFFGDKEFVEYEKLQLRYNRLEATARWLVESHKFVTLSTVPRSYLKALIRARGEACGLALPRHPLNPSIDPSIHPSLPATQSTASVEKQTPPLRVGVSVVAVFDFLRSRGCTPIFTNWLHRMGAEGPAVAISMFFAMLLSQYFGFYRMRHAGQHYIHRTDVMLQYVQGCYMAGAFLLCGALFTILIRGSLTLGSAALQEKTFLAMIDKPEKANLCRVPFLDLRDDKFLLRNLSHWKSLRGALSLAQQSSYSKHSEKVALALLWSFAMVVYVLVAWVKVEMEGDPMIMFCVINLFCLAPQVIYPLFSCLQASRFRCEQIEVIRTVKRENMEHLVKILTEIEGGGGGTVNTAEGRGGEGAKQEGGEPLKIDEGVVKRNQEKVHVAVSRRGSQGQGVDEEDVYTGSAVEGLKVRAEHVLADGQRSPEIGRLVNVMDILSNVLEDLDLNNKPLSILGFAITQSMVVSVVMSAMTAIFAALWSYISATREKNVQDPSSNASALGTVSPAQLLANFTACAEQCMQAMKKP